MTYASKLRSKLDPKHPSNRSFPGTPPVGQEALDRIAEAEFNRKVYGGFNRKLKCPTCFVLLPVATRYCDECGFSK